MAVSINDIKKLRELTSAGMVDCKKALIEAEGDMDKAVELVRKRGLAIAAKREDRQAAEGRVLAKSNGNVAAVLSIKCETEPVANNEKFVALVTEVLDAAMAAGVKNAEELSALPFRNSTVADAIKELSGVTGEKMELGSYNAIEGGKTIVYNHFNHKLSTAVAFNKECDDEVAKNVAMHIATMNPMVATREQLDAEVIEKERTIAIDKTITEQVQKAVENALRKAGFNPYYCATEEHLDEAVRKGYMTEDDVKKAKEIQAATAEQKKASLPQQMIDNIVKGRINKFIAENVLLEQEIDAEGFQKTSVGDYLKHFDKELVATTLVRINLNAD